MISLVQVGHQGNTRLIFADTKMRHIVLVDSRPELFSP